MWAWRPKKKAFNEVVFADQGFAGCYNSTETVEEAYLVITFEKSGLKLDSIWMPSERGVSPKRHLERMMRIN